MVLSITQGEGIHALFTLCGQDAIAQQLFSVIPRSSASSRIFSEKIVSIET